MTDRQRIEQGEILGIGVVVAAVFLALALVFALAGRVKADPEPGTTYSWRTVDGTYSFTDDPGQIPEAYREAAVKSPRGKLKGYPRYTPLGGPSDAAADDDSGEPAG